MKTFNWYDYYLYAFNVWLVEGYSKRNFFSCLFTLLTLIKATLCHPSLSILETHSFISYHLLFRNPDFSWPKPNHLHLSLCLEKFTGLNSSAHWWTYWRWVVRGFISLGFKDESNDSPEKPLITQKRVGKCSMKSNPKQFT